MNIIIPMAGQGKRFVDEGYKIHKPVLPTIDYRSGKMTPMVVCAVKDLDESGDKATNLIFIDRTFHKSDGVQEEIKKYFPKASFITIENLTKGQACTVLEAKKYINNNDELIVGTSDSGMIYSHDEYKKAKHQADVLLFSFRNNEAVSKNPDDYGWLIVDENNNVKDVSIKKHISDTPTKDYAVVGVFWFKKGSIFVEAAQDLIAADDKINNEFYVDQAIKYALKRNYKVKVFEIDRYLCWGTPKDYENYQNTYNYYKEFLETERTKR
jgi:dTDP-glucose pyrophosphorylase